MNKTWFAHLHDEDTLRAAWRRVARRLHPDANPGDPSAEDRFKAAHRDFQRALRRIRTGRTDEVRAQVAEAPLCCAGCGDAFDLGDECPRCGIALHRRGEAASHHDARVDAFVEALHRPPRFDLSGISSDTWARAAAAGLLLFGLVHLKIGMIGTGVMMLGFAAFTFAAEAHQRYRRLRLDQLLG